MAGASILQLRDAMSLINAGLASVCVASEILLDTAGSSRSFTAIRKNAGLCCGSRLGKGEVFAYVGLSQNLKDLKASVLPSTSSYKLGGNQRGGPSSLKVLKWNILGRMFLELAQIEAGAYLFTTARSSNLRLLCVKMVRVTASI